MTRKCIVKTKILKTPLTKRYFAPYEAFSGSLKIGIFHIFTRLHRS